MIKLLTLKDHYWLSVIIFLFYTPLIIFYIFGYTPNRLFYVNYHILIGSLIITLVGYGLTWLSHKQINENNTFNTTDSNNSLKHITLIYVGTILTITNLLFTSFFWINNFFLSLEVIMLSYISI